MDITTNQAAQNFILVYLEAHPSFLETIKRKFASVFDTTQMPMMDKETESRVGVALENFENGEFITVSPDEDILIALDNFEERLQDNTQRQLHVSA